MKPSLEELESRLVPSTVNLTGGVLAVAITGPGTHTLSVDNPTAAQVQVTLDGQASLFDATQVTKLSLTGAKNGTNVIQNNTAIDAVMTGGNLGDSLYGGRCNNVVNTGKGPDLAYFLLGTNTINTAGDGPDRVFTNTGAQVNSDSGDLVVRFFGVGRTAGTPFIGLDTSLNDGVLYITPSNAGSYVRLDAGSSPGAVVATYDLGDGNGLQTQTFADVRAIAYFGGGGNDVYINNTAIQEAAYGSGGNDSLTGGVGEFSLLKGSAGNDTLTGRALHNDIAGNGGADIITNLDGQMGSIFHVDAADTLTGARLHDVLISP